MGAGDMIMGTVADAVGALLTSLQHSLLPPDPQKWLTMTIVTLGLRVSFSAWRECMVCLQRNREVPKSL